MKMIEQFKGKHCIVLGYGRSGKSAIDILLKLGAQVTLTTNEIIVDEHLRQSLIKKDVEIVDGGHPINILDGVDYIVKNPGIPYTIDFIEEALKRNIPVITEVEIASLVSEAPIIGITGTNGKTTVTHLIGEMLKNDGKNPILCGNIGYPASTAVIDATKNDILVLELSSFQLYGTIDFSVDTAVFTNIYEAHIDYHKTKEAYIQAKLNLVRNCKANSSVIFNLDQKELLPSHLPNVEYFSSTKNASAQLDDDYITYKGEKIIHIDDVLIKGAHNYENILCAISAVKKYGVSNEAIVKTVRVFGGIPHRMEVLGAINGVQYYNDSKATNKLATSFALRSFNTPIIWIAGGLDRGDSFDDLKEELQHVKTILAFGQTKEKLIQLAKTLNIEFKSLENPFEAVKHAHKMAEPGDTVLFSPACASWDQYKDFEARGAHFKAGFMELN